MPEVTFSTTFDLEQLKTKHGLFRSCDTERHTLDAALEVFFKREDYDTIKSDFYAFFKRRSLVTPTLPTSVSESMQGGDDFDQRVIHLLPKIFDNVSVKDWRKYDTNIDASIALEFLELFFEEETPAEPLNV